METCLGLTARGLSRPGCGKGGLCLGLAFAPGTPLFLSRRNIRIDHSLAFGDNCSTIQDYNQKRNPYIRPFVQHSVQRTCG